MDILLSLQFKIPGGEMFFNFLELILEGFIVFFGIVSALILIYGGLQAVSKILLIEVFKKPEDYKNVRKEFTDKIIFGLEILIIADIIETLRNPSLDELLVVGAIVIIRTILSYFLSKETEEANLTKSGNGSEA